MTNCKFFLSLLFILLYIFAASDLNAQAGAEDFKPSGKVWGYAFGDFFVKAGGDTATWASRAEYSGVAKDVYAFAIRRMYLGYDYNISPKFFTSALLEANDGLLSQKGDRTVTIKALYLRWKNIYQGADLLAGQMSTLAFSQVSEKVWNYRSVEKTITDQRGIRSSSDLGIAVHGVFDSIGNYGYNLMVGNGTSTRPEDLTPSGKHKLYSGEVYAYLLDRNIVLDLYGDYQTSPNEKDVMTLKGFVAYQSDPITIGVEVLTQTQQNAKPDSTNTSPLGFSVFARSVLIKDRLSAFVRFDSFDPDRLYRDSDIISAYNPSNMHRHYEEQFFLAGLDFSPHKNVHVIPNIWINSYKAKGESSLLPERKADIVPRMTLYFIFR